MENYKKFLINILSYLAGSGLKRSYSLEQIVNCRMKILESFSENGIINYYKKLLEIFEKSNNLEKSDFENDLFWEKYFSADKVWWEDYDQNQNISKLYQQFFTKNKVMNGSYFFSNHKILSSIVGDADWMTIQQKILFLSIIGNYFKNHKELFPVYLNMDKVLIEELDRQKSLYERVIKSNYLFQVFKAALSGAGPFVLKILQQINIGNEKPIPYLDISVQDLTSNIFSKIPALESEEMDLIQKLVSKQHNEDSHFSTLLKNRKRILGSASIAVAFESEYNKQKMVFKLVKPIYLYYFLCECNLLLTKVWKDIRTMTVLQVNLETDLSEEKKQEKINFITVQSRQLLLFFIREFIKEFDYQQEYENTKKGYKMYHDPKKHVRVVEPFKFINFPFPMISLEFINGTTLDKILSISPSDGIISRMSGTDANIPQNEPRQVFPLSTFKQIYQAMRYGVIHYWYKHSFFEDGSYHADLHPGNIIWNDDLKCLYIIDFGSIGQLNKYQTYYLVKNSLLAATMDQMFEHNIREDNYDEKIAKIAASQYIGKYFKFNQILIAKFLRNLLSTCNIKHLSKPEEKYLLDIMERKLYTTRGSVMGDLFLTFVENSSKVGDCVNNDILLWGKTSSYLVKIVYSLQDTLNITSANDYWTVDDTLTRIMTSEKWKRRGNIYLYYKSKKYDIEEKFSPTLFKKPIDQPCPKFHKVLAWLKNQHSPLFGEENFAQLYHSENDNRGAVTNSGKKIVIKKWKFFKKKN